jgi:hypothetical protein
VLSVVLRDQINSCVQCSCARPRAILSGEERVSRNESRPALLTTPTPPHCSDGVLFPLRTSESGRLVLLLPNRHAAGDRSPLSVSVYLHVPLARLV